MEKPLPVWMFTGSRAYERGSHLANDLCLEISQTSSCTRLRCSHLIVTTFMLSQMFKALFLPFLVLSGVLRCAQSIDLVESTPHEGRVSCKVVVFVKCKLSCISEVTLREEFMFRSVTQPAVCVTVSLSPLIDALCVLFVPSVCVFLGESAEMTRQLNKWRKR